MLSKLLPLPGCREWRQSYCTVYPQEQLADVMLKQVLPAVWLKAAGAVPGQQTGSNGTR